ncbi:hypothetical protein CLF_110456 [Clonorchis sinensis]|uniref:Endonuclease/exonuclease/phosphatase domain-containing protein n=1 Tax=Clonorchis sinensis TaxID=79923 RepID=G7YKQ9_CLOSI|nr:hypothetical protein CLF_110456 [Clonorchis sinensis]
MGYSKGQDLKSICMAHTLHRNNLDATRDATESLVYDILQLNVLYKGQVVLHLVRYSSYRCVSIKETNKSLPETSTAHDRFHPSWDTGHKSVNKRNVSCGKSETRTSDLVKQQSWHHPADQIELKPKTTAEASRPWTIGLVARVTKASYFARSRIRATCQYRLLPAVIEGPQQITFFAERYLSVPGPLAEKTFIQLYDMAIKTATASLVDRRVEESRLIIWKSFSRNITPTKQTQSILGSVLTKPDHKLPHADWLRQKGSKQTLGLLVTFSSPSAVQNIPERVVSTREAYTTTRRLSGDRPIETNGDTQRILPTNQPHVLTSTSWNAENRTTTENVKLLIYTFTPPKVASFIVGTIVAKSENCRPLEEDHYIIRTLEQLSSSYHFTHLLLIGDSNVPKAFWMELQRVGSSRRFAAALISAWTQHVIAPTRYRAGHRPSLLDLVTINERHFVDQGLMNAPLEHKDHCVLIFHFICYWARNSEPDNVDSKLLPCRLSWNAHLS